MAQRQAAAPRRLPAVAQAQCGCGMVVAIDGEALAANGKTLKRRAGTIGQC